MSQAQDVTESAGHAQCTVGRVAVLIWKTPPSTGGIDETRHLFRALASRQPKDKFAFLTIIEAEATTLSISSEVRESLSGLLKEFQQQLSAAVVVVDAEGFRASLVRTFVATINLGNRLAFRANTERDLDAAARWLAARDPALHIDAMELTDALTRLRSRWSGGPKVRDLGSR